MPIFSHRTDNVDQGSLSNAVVLKLGGAPPKGGVWGL